MSASKIFSKKRISQRVFDGTSCSVRNHNTYGCRAEIITKDGKRYLSDECEPRGEAKENISVDWLCDKFKRITAPVLTSDGQEKLLRLITENDDLPIRTIVDTANKNEYYK